MRKAMLALSTVALAVGSSFLSPPAEANPNFDHAIKVWQHKGQGVNGISAWQAGHDKRNLCLVRSITDSASADKVEAMQPGDRVLFRRARVFRLGGYYTVTAEPGPCRITVIGEPADSPSDDSVWLVPAS